MNLSQNPELREKCGIVAIHHSGVANRRRADIGPLLYYSLFSLQHRGQDSLGFSVYDSEKNANQSYKSRGLLSTNFQQQDLERLQGNVGIAHVRYATTGGSSLENIQPIEQHSLYGTVAMAHNGNLTNTIELRKHLQKKGLSLTSSSDTELFLKLFIYHLCKAGQEALLESLDANCPMLEYALRKTSNNARAPIRLRLHCATNCLPYATVLAFAHWLSAQTKPGWKLHPRIGFGNLRSGRHRGVVSSRCRSG